MGDDIINFMVYKICPIYLAPKCSQVCLIEDDCKRKPCQVSQSRMCCFVLLEMLPLWPDPTTSPSRACGRKFSPFLSLAPFTEQLGWQLHAATGLVTEPGRLSGSPLTNLSTTSRAPHTAGIQ